MGGKEAEVYGSKGSGCLKDISQSYIYLQGVPENCSRFLFALSFLITVTFAQGRQDIYMPNITCFHCDAPTYEECVDIGESKQCAYVGTGPPTCMIELRKRNGGLFGVCMGCKAQEACLKQKENNFPLDPWHPWQCRPTDTAGPSVCRQCCDTDNCTKDFLNTANVDGDGNGQDNYVTWNQDMLVVHPTPAPAN